MSGLIDPRTMRDGQSVASAGSTVILHEKVYEITFDAASINAATAAEQDVTVPGVLATDMCVAVQPPALGVAAGVGAARVKSANTIAVTFINPTAGALNPNAGVYKFWVIRYQNLS